MQERLSPRRKKAMKRAIAPFALTLLLVSATGPTDVLAQQVPTPLQHFGQEIGTDGFLADWNELSAYYEAVAAASPRVTIDTIGPTTLGAPFLRLIITSEENHGNLDRYLDIQNRLADPRRVSDDAEVERLIEEGRTVVLITSHIHSTEVAAGQMPARLVYNLATSDEPRIREILDETIVVMIPSLNPDGTQMVSEWWREWQGTEFEGAPLPRLYHHYIGHNNNRDWFFFAQTETRMTVLEAHNLWKPQIVHDVHQMGGGAARFFVPPYIDPVEPNVDPRLIAGLNQLGKYIAAEMTRDGLDGVVTDAIFDIYTPARAYMHYHGGVRILSETASARWANPVEVDFEDLGSTADYDAQVMSSNFPSPWRGGRWGLDDAVDYMEAGAMALLTNAAKNREFWLRNYAEIHRDAVAGWDTWPDAWVIPAGQDNEMGLDHLLRVLTTGNVEVHRAESAFQAGGRTFPEGSFVVPMQQPYASFAQTMLEAQEYPDLRQYPGGPPVRPYDATAHTLPLLFGVEAVAVESMPTANNGVELSDPIPQRTELTFEVPAFLQGPDAPRIGLYRAWQEPMPQGWTRWLFDHAGVAYEEVRNDDVRAGGLNERYDVIVFQDQSPNSILNGFNPNVMPEPYAGGIGEEGVRALREFVENGGRVVAFDAATGFAIDAFDLEVRNAVDDLPDADFYIPGSILRLDLDPAHPISEGHPSETIAWYWRTSRAFDVDDPRATVVGTFGEGDPRLAGWVLGEEHVAGKPALVEVEVGEGSVVLFGFQPNFRGQTVALYRLFFNSLR
jgi:hypothetical protein